MMSDTPRTDAAKRKIDGFADEWVPRYVSEELERERDKAMEIVRAVAHIGVDFGHGEYELSDDYIKTARELLSGDSPTEDDQ